MDLRLQIRPLRPEDQFWLETFLVERWGSVELVVRGEIHAAHLLPGCVAEIDGKLVGVVTYRFEADACEIMTLDSLREGQGIGTRLITAAIETARAAGCTHVFLVTTNDNLNALRFYQKRGFALTAVRPNAVARSRLLKPPIPAVGQNGIPLRDEIDLAYKLT